MRSNTVGGVRKMGSKAMVLSIATLPETEMFSGSPTTSPLINSETLLTLPSTGVATAAAAAVPPTCASAVVTRKGRARAQNHARCIFMFVSFSESRRLDFGRRPELHPLRERDRRRQRPHERRAAIVDFPAQQHGVVLVHRVMAVLHEHPAKVPELECDRDVSAGAQPPDILAAPLPSRHVRRRSVARERLAFLEVDVDRMIPAAAAVPQVPDLA